MKYDFEIDKAFKNALKPATARSYHALKKKIKDEGCQKDAFVVANINGRRYLIDGHNSLEICEELNIQITTPRELNFPDREAVLDWIIEHQGSRRNLSEEVMDKLRSERVARVADAKSNGESLRKIAKDEGVSEFVVREDLKKATAMGIAVEPKNLRVTGRDGRIRTSKPAIAPRTASDIEVPRGSVKEGKPTLKAGKPIFDDRPIDDLYGKLLRSFDARFANYGKAAKEKPFHKEIIDCMDKLLMAWKRWQRDGVK